MPAPFQESRRLLLAYANSNARSKHKSLHVIRSLRTNIWTPAPGSGSCLGLHEVLMFVLFGVTKAWPLLFTRLIFREVQQVLPQSASDSVGDRRREEDGVVGGGADRGARPVCFQGQR